MRAIGNVSGTIFTAAERSTNRWHLRLYIADQSAKSMTALANLRRLCSERLGGHCDVEVIDLLRNPARAKSDEIVAIPTLVWAEPGKTRRRVFGDLSNTQRVLSGLGLGAL